MGKKKNQKPSGAFSWSTSHVCIQAEILPPPWPVVILRVGEALTWWQHLCSVQAAHHRFALSQQGGGGRQSWAWRAARQCWEGIEPFRGHKAFLSVCGHQPHLCSIRFCAVQKTDLSPRLYLRGWAHDFSIISKFMSWGFKNTSVSWRWPWNVSVVQCCSPCFYQQHPEMEQLKHPLWARTRLDWLEEAPKDLLEISSHLLFQSLCKGALPWSLGSSTPFMCREATHVSCGDGGKLPRATRLLISDLRDSSSKSCFARTPSFTQFPWPSISYQ